ncbi:hypothetical protein UJ101_02690 [Flavobacteriaceae bacterium UJ101]|nr:hypothetical protein UJ101_02690 [Flavobacteriaceae bacterium UJ101]
MNTYLSFIRNEKIKIIATCIVAIIFTYFWINGPLLHTIEILSLESIETEYSKPIMVGKDGVDNKTQLTSFNTIKLADNEVFGHGLILDKEKTHGNWGFTADEQSNPGLSEKLQKDIEKHALLFSSENELVKIHPSMSMYYAVISSKQTHNKQLYLESTDIIHNVRGYAGDINVGVIIGEDGLIKRVEHIASKETKSYLSDIKKSGFYEQFKEVSIMNGAQEIDAVSGATLTSEAIATTVSKLVKEGIPDPISNYTNTNEVNFFNLKASLNNYWIFHIIVIFLMFVFSIQKWTKKSKKSIILLSLLSVLYLGFFLNNSFTYISFIHPFLGTSVSSFVGLYSLFVLLGAIWGKNTYCKYICPFGNIQRLIIYANPVKTSRKFFISNKWIKRIRAAIAIIILTGILLGLRNWSNFELFPDLFGLSILSVWFIIAVITVLTTIIYPMIWCRLLCPTGSILDGITDSIKIIENKTRKYKLK